MFVWTANIVHSIVVRFSALTPSLLRTVGFTDISYTVLSSADLEVVTLALFILSDVIKQSVPDSNESPSFRVGPRRLRSLSVWLTWCSVLSMVHADRQWKWRRELPVLQKLSSAHLTGYHGYSRPVYTDFRRMPESTMSVFLIFTLYFHWRIVQTAAFAHLKMDRWAGRPIKSGTASTSPADIKHTWTNYSNPGMKIFFFFLKTYCEDSLTCSTETAKMLRMLHIVC